MKKISFLGLIVVAFIAMAFFQATSYKVSGVVKDENGQPIAGASVQVKGTHKGVATDTAGRFTIELKKKKEILMISYIGMDGLEVKVDAGSKMNLALKKSRQSLDEVVVVGYGTKRKSVNMAYATQSLSGRGSGLVAANFDGKRQVSTGSDTTMAGDREGYDHIIENRFKAVTNEPLSTFSIDVDGASYSNVRRYLNSNALPPAGAVRIEELINYFHYEYPQPQGKDPFSINTELAECPWNSQHKLALIGLQGKRIATDNLPPSNLVFLIDVSGSMMEENKLPLVKSSLKMLVDQLRQQDKVSLVVYAGAAGIVLPPTSGSNKAIIIDAIDKLEAGGSTAGGAGIELAYKTAVDHFMKQGNNRVILCTDGDFNVGTSSDDELETLIETERKSGVFLSICGFGTGNYQDAKMQKLADKGNGNHSYIDNINEAKKVFVNEFGGTLFTIAKDVKLQIEFNPAKVQGYRLIGYENRMLNQEDFNNDKKDAGELGSGHTVTALYEIIPIGVKDGFLESVDALKYQRPMQAVNGGDELMAIKFRYKEPEDSTSKLMVHAVKEQPWAIGSAMSDNFRFAAAVAEFGLLLRHSEFKKDASWENTLALAKGASGKDTEGYRKEFIQLISNAQALAKTKTKAADDLTINE